MYRVSVLYGHPNDPEAFDKYYRDVHIPLARKMRGLTAWTLTWVDSANGPLSDVYLIADLYAESKEELNEILASPEGRAAADDITNFATGGATMLFGESQQVELA